TKIPKLNSRSVSSSRGLCWLTIVHCFLGWRDGFSVDDDVFELGAEGVAYSEAAFCFDVHIFEGDVAQWALREARQMAGCTAIFGGKIASGDSAKSGSAFIGWRWFAELLRQPGCAKGI